MRCLTWTLRKVDKKYRGNIEMCCWRWIEKIIWTDRVRNEVLHIVKEERNIIHTVKRRKVHYSGHKLRRNYLVKHVIE